MIINDRYRVVKTKPTYQKGDTTSMNWNVVDILRIDNGKTYTIQQYDLLSDIRYRIRKTYDIVSKFNFMKLAEISFFIYFFKNIM